MASVPELLESDYTDLSTNDFIVEMYRVADSQESHPAFQGTLPEYVSPAPKIRLMADELGKVRDAAAGGNRHAALEKKELRGAAQLALSMNASHVTMLSLTRKDPGLLANSGYLPKQRAGRKPRVNLLELTPAVSLKHRGTQGAIVVRVTRAKKRANIELRRAQDPADETSCRSLGIYSKSLIELKDLEPATRVYISARYHEHGGTGPWTKPVAIIVL